VGSPAGAAMAGISWSQALVIAQKSEGRSLQVGSRRRQRWRYQIADAV
jgi:hypothetical protein